MDSCPGMAKELISNRNKIEKMKKALIVPFMNRILILLGVVLLVIACSKGDDSGNIDEGAEETEVEVETIDSLSEEEEVDALPTIIDLVVSDDNLTTLLQGLRLTGTDLTEALSGEGPFTVFAPGNAAFDSFFVQVDRYQSLSDFDTAEKKALLAEILKYHVVKGSAAFSDYLSNGTVLETLQGEEISVAVDGSVFLEDKTDCRSEVIGADNEALNGAVHIVDKVLLPESSLSVLFPKPTIFEVIETTEELSRFEEALAKADLADMLNGEGLFTVFAPTDAAVQQLFVTLGDEYNSLDDFKNPVELQILNEILLGHIVGGKVAFEDLEVGTLPTLLPNDSIGLVVKDDTFVIKDASGILTNFESFDWETSNGTVHTIDKILIPRKVLAFVE